ncbi:MAG: hypothetical protein LBR31_03285 [Desulfovibrio sp.]|jgi:cell fate regulator YaaT (PSP1 superfamily)|nr:hypothetical protein [Desulfovibrio sp.]
MTYHAAPEALHPGDGVLVQTEQGMLFALVASGPLEAAPDACSRERPAAQETPETSESGEAERETEADRETRPDGEPEQTDLPRILRPATPQDWSQERKNRELAREAARFCRERIARLGLDMKLVDVEVFFDCGKVIFYFTAPSRIDFRELVKELVQQYHTRVELRQIGVRHETQMVGAVGNCGMVCCCRRYLRKFASVTIRMAKEQNLFLNPTKISGICGRLLCCLSYEQDNYDHFHKNCPRLNRRYQTSRGPMKVIRMSMFHNTLVALTENNEELEFGLDEWRSLVPQRAEAPPTALTPAAKEAPPLLVVSAAPENLEGPDTDVSPRDDGREAPGEPEAAHKTGSAPERRRGRRRSRR